MHQLYTSMITLAFRSNTIKYFNFYQLHGQIQSEMIWRQLLTPLIVIYELIIYYLVATEPTLVTPITTLPP